ncbi:MAG TPA: DUF6062 family protein [Roseiflexaceae bacterium]|nr:DUF6062 family protein [Roseiflexaceae bacterium]
MSHTLFFELREALAGPECALCALLRRSLRRYLDAVAYEGVGDRRVREVIRASRGFCAAHGRMLRASRDALGAAIVHRDVLGTLMRQLSEAQRTPPTIEARLRRAVRRPARDTSPLPAEAPCPACIYLREQDEVYGSALAHHVGDGTLEGALRASAGLCLPHLRATLARAPDTHTFDRLREAQLEVWRRLADELDEFIRKQDYRFQAEPSGAESDSWARAIGLVSGEPGLIADSWG